MNFAKTYITTFLTVTTLLSTISFSSDCQNTSHPKNYFRAPVDFTMTLSGNFAELRNNHFHSGIDIRTFTTGKKVYAIADGFVSRIKVSSGGYGKALYVDHPNGYTSVYTHLDSFGPHIEKFVRSHQYQNKTFGFDISLKKEQLPVKKGAVIAISGNSGSSSGPHLHFEIRDTKTEHPLNPLFFGFKIKDTTPPKIFNLFIYPLDSTSSVNGKNKRMQFPVTFYNNKFHLKSDPKIKLYGNIGFALQTNDYLDNTWGRCGIYQLNMKINDTLITDYSFNEFSFNESRYINSHMDYELNVRKKKRVHKTFREDNNKLSIYSHMVNNGVYHFKENKKYKIDFLVFDVAKNKASLRVFATGAKPAAPFKNDNHDKLLKFDEKSVFLKEDIEIKFPENCFYSDLKFKYNVNSDSMFLSNVHNIHSEFVPVHKYYSLSLKLNDLPQKTDKLYVVRVDRKGKMANEGGIYIDGWMKTKSRHFGNFAVAIDTVPPTITARTNFKLKSLANQKNLKFTIEDKLSGIKSYTGTIDGKWVLFEYDAKNDKLFYTFDRKRLLSNKKHQLKLNVTDRVGNSNSFIKEFYW